MLWQFGELGYDFSINRCEDGTISDNCRLSSKPVRWDYFQKQHRRNTYDKMSALLYLRNEHDVFHTPNFSLTDNAYFKRVKLNGQEMNALTLANFDVREMVVEPQFQHTGTWYEYFSGEELSVSDVNAEMELSAGEYRIYTSKRVTPPNGYFSSTSELTDSPIIISPNPVKAGEQVSISSSVSFDSALLYDATGRTSSLALECTDSNNCKVLLPGELVPGVYFLSLKNGETWQSIQLIVSDK